MSVLVCELEFPPLSLVWLLCLTHSDEGCAEDCHSTGVEIHTRLVCYTLLILSNLAYETTLH